MLLYDPSMASDVFDIAKAAFELYKEHCPEGFFVHALGVTASGFDRHIEQLQIGASGGEAYEKREKAENAVAKIREKYGYEKLQRGLILEDEQLVDLDIKARKD
jgi:hypothetical protein